MTNNRDIRKEVLSVLSTFDDKRRQKKQQERPEELTQGVLRELREYTGKQEKRPPPRSLKSTRIENGMGSDDLKYISDALTSDSVLIGGRLWTSDELCVGNHRKLGTSGVRKELEVASDKLHLMKNAPDIVLQAIVYAINDYKAILHEPTIAVIMGAKAYIADLKSSGVLSPDELDDISNKDNITFVITSSGFSEFFFDWIKTAPNRVKSIVAKSDRQWFQSVINIARTGTINVNDKTPASKLLHEYLLIETAYRYVPTVVELALFFDPGFRYYMSGLGGKHVYYWDWIRNEAERHKLYSGQL